MGRGECVALFAGLTWSGECVVPCAGLSGRKTLEFYAGLKGVPASQVAAQVARLLRRLGFKAADADKPMEKYSGGMKRRLSVAMASVGGASDE